MPENAVLRTEDPIEVMIRDSGWLENPNLWRQWIFTQMIRTCQARDMDEFHAKFFDVRPYAYQWETAIRELKMHVRTSSKEPAIRPMFFPFPVLIQMLSDYKIALDEFFRNPGRQRKDGNGLYVSVKGERIYLAPVQGRPSAVTYKRRAEKALSQMRRAQKAGSYRFAIKTAERFKSTALLSANLPKSQAWMDAFTGNGAYYTMDNLVRFYGCRFLGMDKKPLSLRQSLDKLASLALSLQSTPDAMFDLMSALLDDNPEIRDALCEKQEDKEDG